MQATINEWFDLRNVCSDENFTVFFQRVLKRDYLRYTQLLRVEPGVAQYDWLVQNYRERKLDLSRSDSRTIEFTKGGTVQNSVEKEGSSSMTDNTSEQTSGTSGNTRTFDTEDTTSQTSSGTRTIDRDTVRGDQTTDTVADSGTSTGTSSSSDVTDHAGLQKAAPMSVEYTTLVGGVTQQLPPLSWASATSQEQDGTTATSSSSDSTTSNSSSQRAGTLDSTVADDTSEATSGTLSGTLNKDGTITDAGTTSGTKTGNGSHTGSTTEQETGTTTYNTEDSTSDSSEGASTSKEISTGRVSDPAEILQKAVAFIEATNAFEWLKNQLEPCFIGVYDI